MGGLVGAFECGPRRSAVEGIAVVLRVSCRVTGEWVSCCRLVARAAMRWLVGEGLGVFFALLGS